MRRLCHFQSFKANELMPKKREEPRIIVYRRVMNSIFDRQSRSKLVVVIFSVQSDAAMKGSFSSTHHSNGLPGIPLIEVCILVAA